ncbi:MAG: electron transport complex subunit RsxC [Termitinemataceae bacterium]|nr:MAG: electron transport complex subunit RsxC [Termitinemataceae bacterium]
MKQYSFNKGGITFNDDFAPARKMSVLSFLPGISIVVLRSFSGNPSYPIVQPGAHVEEGMLIARRQGSGSANIHSPIPGDIIQSFSWKLTDNLSASAIAVRLCGKFERLGRKMEMRQWEDLSQFAIRQILDDNGVVEMEGEGKPICDTFTAYNTSENNFTLVLRCVFDDPWLVADYCVSKERSLAVAVGCILTARAAGASSLCIAISKDDEEIGTLLQNEIKNLGAEAEIAVLSGKYPQHSNKQIEKSLSDRLNTPQNSFLIVCPSTAAAVYDAVVFNKPVLDRYVAVGGQAVNRPSVLNVRIGSRIGDIFKECGGFSKKPDHLVIGSPLLGRNVSSLDEPILKNTSVVYAALSPKKEKLLSKLRKKLGGDSVSSEHLDSSARCIGCGECRRVCPSSLDPEDLYKRMRDGKHDDSLISIIVQCDGCGCCESVCPSHLNLCSAIVKPAFAERTPEAEQYVF